MYCGVTLSTLVLFCLLCNCCGVAGYRIASKSQDLSDDKLYELLRGDNEDVGKRQQVKSETPAVKCKNDRLDVIFLIDSSSKSSAGESGWQSLLSFVNEMIDSFSVGQDAVHVGVVRYADVVDTPISLTDFTDKESLKSAVSGLSFVDRPNANLITAFNDAYRMAITQGRQTSSASLVVVSDTVPINSQELIADAVKSFQSENVHVSFVAVQKPNEGPDGISGSGNVPSVYVKDYSEMSAHLSEAVSNACPLPSPRALCCFLCLWCSG
jgi:uncharacterized protein YegL